MSSVLSPPETEALAILAGYGISLGAAAAYIGQLRKELLGEATSLTTPGQIVDCVMHLIFLDKKLFEIPSPNETLSEAWAAEYSFFYKIITAEVDRLRFNQGLEPIDCDLYPASREHPTRWLGKTRIGHQTLRVLATETTDQQGKAILRLQIRKEQTS